MLSDEQMHDRMKNGWRGGLPETKCGIGSTMQSTSKVRIWLADICLRYDIQTISNAGAGELFWIESIKWRHSIREHAMREHRPVIEHYDLIVRDKRVRQFDITKETLPKRDAVLCRHCLNHLDNGRILSAIERFRESGSRFLIATQFDREVPGDHREFSRLDLRIAMRHEPLESCEDGGAEGCLLAIWRLN